MRQTLARLARDIDLRTEEVPTGTAVFDWSIPREWTIRDAYVKGRDGVRIVDFATSNLHVISYSAPVHKTLTGEELDRHLASIPEHPDWIPYKTSYYAEDWGFCVTERQRASLPKDDTYEVCIDSSLEDGHLTLGQCVLPGRERAEVLISCHTCHPSLCNDNLSGISVATTLARLLAQVPRRHTFRFLFNPGTIGTIAWLALHEEDARRIEHGLVLACVGDRGPLHYKRSRRGDADIDRAVRHVLGRSRAASNIRDFTPYGYDERQFCSPGFNLPVGLLSRTPNGCFPEYHTSADNLEFVDAASLTDSLVACLGVIEVLEGNATYLTRNPNCEPQLGRRGLYQATGGHGERRQFEMALLWVLNLSDGNHTLLDIAERSGLQFDAIRSAADVLADCDLIEPSEVHAQPE